MFDARVKVSLVILGRKAEAPGKRVGVQALRRSKGPGASENEPRGGLCVLENDASPRDTMVTDRLPAWVTRGQIMG